MFYLAYLDEFGHDGPYVSRHHARFNTSPVFGLGGMILPVEQVRPFATWFYQLKCRLFEREIRLGQREPYRWEKKGADVFKPKNVHRYASIRSAGHRILNRIRRSGGYVFYVGMEKSADPDQHDAKRLYKAVLRETVKRLDQFCEGRDAHLLLMMDEHGFRRDIVATASAEMFRERRRHLVEPPVQVESHLYQTLQCADWICGLLSRCYAYACDPQAFEDYHPVHHRYAMHIRQVAVRSSVRRLQQSRFAPDDGEAE